MRDDGFSLIELLVAIAVAVVLGSLIFVVGRKVYAASSLAVSANNIRQLAAGGMAYLGDHQNTYWRYQERMTGKEKGFRWWFGFEPASSVSKPEGQRDFDPSRGLLGEYVPKSLRPDPSFAMGGRAFKPKYRNGYIGIGYNTILGGGTLGMKPQIKQTALGDPSKVVVFFTSAQVNTFTKPASPRNPMLEECYFIDEKEVTAHFRHGGKALVAFANGSVDFLPMDESTRDQRAPQANVGRFAPVGSRRYLE
jgi:prepilin-type N-terminal cleavage/methylation domain-containing protein